MRKIFSLGLLALFLASISTVLVAGFPACDDDEELRELLKELGVYGWCNAWHSAEPGSLEQSVIRDRILERADWTELPWVSEDVCPCWSLEDIRQEVACAELPQTDSTVDTELRLGADFVEFSNTGVKVSVYAGFAEPWEPASLAGPEDSYPECVLFGLAATVLQATDQGEDDACREDVLNLIHFPPTSAECSSSP